MSDYKKTGVEPVEHVKEIEPYVVANTQSALETPDEALKLDWNEGTIGPAKPVVNGIKDFVGSNNVLNWYPDTSNEELRQAISQYIGVDKKHIEVFVGSDGALDYIARTFISDNDLVKIVGPTYDQFRISAESCGADIETLLFEDPFSTDVDSVIDKITHPTDVVYLANPNNPTGTLYEAESIRRVAETYPSTLFIIDEAYFEFVDAESATSLVSELENVIVLRTFSKAFCLAGLRLGYAIADSDNILSYIRRIKNPKEINRVAQKAGVLTLDNLSYYEDYIQEVRKARSEFVAKLRNRGWDVRETPANFVMVRVNDPETFINLLKEKKIYVRDRSYLPQLDGFIRITVGDSSKMEEVLSEMDKYED